MAGRSLNIISVDPSLRSTGVYRIIDGIESWLVIQRKEPRLEALAVYLKYFLKFSAKYDLLIIEDYSFGSKGAGVTVQAEVGGIIRSVFAAHNIPIIEVPIQSWKAVTKIKTPKANAREYVDEINGKYKKHFSSEHVADAFLFYQTVKIASSHDETMGYKPTIKGLSSINEVIDEWSLRI